MLWHFEAMKNLRFMAGNLMALCQQEFEGVKASLQSQLLPKL